MLAWMSLPMATTAVGKSAAPSWRRASTSVASARTTWVIVGAHAWTTCSEASTPITSWPRSAERAGEGLAEPAEADHERLVVATQRCGLSSGWL